MRGRVRERGLADQVQVISAGVWAEDGHAASQNAVTVLGQRDIDLSGHLSQRVTMDLLKQADIVLVMEEAHRRSIFYLAPQYLAKVFLLAEMAGEYDDIADPYGQRVENYIITADLLEKIIDAGLPKILRRLSINTSAA
jgi:protein-tyrosine-phosphatase